MTECINKSGHPIAFTFSTSQELGGTGCCKKFLIFGSIFIYCAIFPILYFIGPESGLFSKTDISYAAIMYYLVFNTLIIIGICYFVVGCVSYPYSNTFFSSSNMR